MKKILLALLVLISIAAARQLHHRPLIDAWNPDAGLIPSFTENANIIASSNPAEAAKIIDGDPATAWQSDAPLPEGFFKRTDLNIWLHQAGFPEKTVDGDLATSEKLSSREFAFTKPIALFSLSIKCQLESEIAIRLVSVSGKSIEIGSISAGESFQLKRFEAIPKAETWRSVILTSGSDFNLFEIAALGAPPKEFIVLDMGAVRPVGVVHTRHWAGEGTADSTRIFISNDAKNWTPVAELDPAAVHPCITNVLPETPARYLKLEHTLAAKDWNKVFLWEVSVYDRFGHYGQRPPAQPGSVTLREMLGVNAYWSWGTDQYADLLDDKAGPKRYRPLASHARNYHDMTWDLTQPADQIDFAKMAAGGGTPALEWLNWDREYKAWQAAGLNVEASLQFYKFKPSEWKNPYREAYDYAQSFTRHFGAKQGNGLVCTIEAGNEPWKYDAETYRKILLGMAKGAEAGDPTVEVFPCALQAADPAAEKSEVFKNYIGARLSPEAAPFLDGINIHCYSYANDRRGKRRAVQPEHVNSSFWETINAIRWRDHNMPGKKIYLSEWGWDSDGATESCTHDECVSEQAAAAYALRGALIAARLGLDRASWFYYANDKNPSSLYTRSGLTGSVTTGFQKKKVFIALESLVKYVGDRYFLAVLQEDEKAWIYLLGDRTGKPTHLVAWLPFGGDEVKKQVVSCKTKLKPVQAIRLDGSSIAGASILLPTVSKGAMMLDLSVFPVVVKVE